MAKDDERLKSAVELAMERLREQDRESGRDEPRALTDEQKRAIAEVRRRFEAKVAETKILHESSVRKAVEAGDAEKLGELEQQHSDELARLDAEREAEVEALRSD